MKIKIFQISNREYQRYGHPIELLHTLDATLDTILSILNFYSPTLRQSTIAIGDSPNVPKLTPPHPNHPLTPSLSTHLI